MIDLREYYRLVDSVFDRTLEKFWDMAVWKKKVDLFFDENLLKNSPKIQYSI